MITQTDKDVLKPALGYFLQNMARLRYREKKCTFKTWKGRISTEESRGTSTLHVLASLLSQTKQACVGLKCPFKIHVRLWLYFFIMVEIK